MDKSINFTIEYNIYKGFSTLNILEQLKLTVNKIDELKQIQLADGSFDLKQNFADFLSVNINDFNDLKLFLIKQGLNSLGKTEGKFFSFLKM